MPIELTWPRVLLRLGLALAASAVVGLNRSEHGRAAGLRTTILVCLAATGAMIQANLLLAMAHEKQSLVTLDLMRLPLGILSGIGFIGAGAIVRRGNFVTGVTTAATLWYVTVMGLAFGGGQLTLGLELLGVGLFVLWALKRVELRFVHDREATVEVIVRGTGLTEVDVRRDLEAAGLSVASCSVTYALERRRFECVVRWRSDGNHRHTPDVVDRFAAAPGVTRVSWRA